MMCAKRFDQKGFGLLFTLLLITLLAGVASTAFHRAQNQFFLVGTHAQHMQALTLAKAGVNLSRAGLLFDKNQKDDLEEDWHLLSAASQMSPIPLGNGFVSIEIIDEDRKQNINSMSEQDLRKYFETLKLRRVRKGDIIDIDIVEDNIHDELADAYLDWTDFDDQEREQGAESRWYRRQDVKAIPHNQRIATLGELLWIKGFTPEMLFGRKGNPRLLDMVTIYGGAQVNVNTASEEVLTTLIGQEDPYIAPTVAQAILEQRPFGTVGQAKNLIEGYGVGSGVSKKITVKSQYFRIRSTGIIGNTRSIVEAVVKRSGKTCDILFWKEMPEHG